MRPLVVLLALGACRGAVHEPGGAAVAPGAESPSGTEAGALPRPFGARDAGAPDARASQVDASVRWRPAVGVTWQWQLSGAFDPNVRADVYDVDLFTTPASSVAALHAAGRRVVCYLSAGSREDFRADVAGFPPAVVGKPLDGWPGERWLDVRRIADLAPVMRARLDLCRSKGFDGVEPDNVDGWTNDTGFPLTAQDQLAYNAWLAAEAHARGLAVALKNDEHQAAALEPAFDFAITESCAVQGWCAQLSPFVAAGKPVLAAEYMNQGATLAGVCPVLGRLRFSGIVKRRDLDAWREACP